MEDTAADTAAGMLELVRAHRSIRRFSGRTVDAGMIERLLEDALAGSSSSGNLNQVSVICTRDPARKNALSTLHLHQAMVREAPLVLTFCADVFRTRAWLEQRQVPNNFDNLLGYHAAAIDAVIVAQTMALLLESQGLGMCFVGTTLHWASEIGAYLGLPEHCMPITTMVVGWPAEQPPRRERLPGAAWIHDERYRLPTGESIEQSYGPYEEQAWRRYTDLGAHITDKMATMGITSLASYTTSEIGYPPAVFERDSARLQQLLVEKGFLPRQGAAPG